MYTGALQDEAYLLAGLRAGSNQAFQALDDRYRERLMGIARRLLGDDDDALDAVQETFISAFTSIHRFRDGSPFMPWLYRIVTNTALMKLRRRRRVHGLKGFQAVSPADGLERQIRRQEDKKVVQQLLSQLPDTYRTVVQLFYFRECNTAEAARYLGVSCNAVKIRLHRAHRALRGLANVNDGPGM